VETLRRAEQGRGGKEKRGWQGNAIHAEIIS
jgi:hypothetical protein